MFPVLFHFIWLTIQAFTAFSLCCPAVFLILSVVRHYTKKQVAEDDELYDEKDYAIIVPAYNSSPALYDLLECLTKLDYSNYLVYVTGNRLSTADAYVHNDKIVYLRTAKDHHPRFLQRFVLENFRRPHTHVVILCPDSLVEKDYLTRLNTFFNQGYQAVVSLQHFLFTDGIANILQSVIGRYRCFFGRKLLFSAGASATLEYSGSAFAISSYKPCLKTKGETAGFTSLMQTRLAIYNRRIAFAGHAVVYRQTRTTLHQLAAQHAQRVHDWMMCLRAWNRTMLTGIWQRDANLVLTGLFSLRMPLPTAALLGVACLAVNAKADTSMARFWAGLLTLASVYLITAMAQWRKQNVSPDSSKGSEKEADKSLTLYEPEEDYKVIAQTI